MAIAARAVDRVRAILAFITFGHRSVEFSAQHPVASLSCGFSHIPEITFLRDHILKFETTLNNGVPIPSGIFAAIRPRHNAGYGLAIESSDISAPVGQLLRRKDAASSPQASKGSRSAACTGQLSFTSEQIACAS